MKRLSLLLLLLSIILAGCARQPRQPGTLRLADSGDVSTLDPALAFDTRSVNYVRILYRGLVDYDAGANLVNAVARERSVSPDGKTYTFKLRRDVRFHSGRRVVAEDFRYAIERVLTPATASGGFSFYQIIDGAKEFSDGKTPHVRGIQVKGDDQISFTLKHPDPTFLNVLAMGFAYAVPRESVEKWGKAFSEHPDGCGPFRLAEWRHDAWLRLEKNPDYFQPNLPHCDAIELSIGVLRCAAPEAA